MNGDDALLDVILETLASDVAISLRVEAVEPSDDFFDLGGDSLLAASLLARMRERFSVDVSLLDLFDDTTIRGIAQALARSCGDPGDAGSP
jgi:acyl carrier protein